MLVSGEKTLLIDYLPHADGAKGAEIYLHTECTERHRTFRQKDIRTYFCRRNFAILCDFA